ncbi:MAG TPA: hypothetical protein VJB16_06755, partial [archaeon]|nr:hypothetical protein [archaeon]
TQTDSATGTVTATGADACLPGNKITEYVCTDANDIDSVDVACNGVCRSQDATAADGTTVNVGSCVSLSACVDSDGGATVADAGVTTATSPTGQKTTRKDSCSADRSAVNENWCDGASITSARTECAATETCVGGACVPKDSQCSDSDGGRNYKSKGTVTNRVGGSVTDTCSGQKGLLEFSCSRALQANSAGQVTKWGSTSASYKLPRIRVERVTCPSGCTDGACTGSQLASPPTAEEAAGDD